MRTIPRPPAWLIGFAAAALAAALAAVFLSLPEKVFLNPDWFDQGIRLFRDDFDLRVYFGYSSWAATGHWPYTAGQEQAYPPLAAAYFALPRLLFGDFAGYERGLLAMNVVLFGVLCGLSVMLLRSFGRSPRAAWLLLLPTSLYFTLWRFDVLPAVLVALLIWSAARKKYHLSLIFLAGGIFTKYYPAVFFIPLLMLMGSSRLAADELRRLAKTVIVIGSAVMAAGLILAVTSGSGLLIETVVLHLTRKFEVGSLAAAMVGGAAHLGLPALGTVQALSLSLVLLQAVAPVLLLMRGRINDGSAFVRGGLFILMPLILLNRFYSQQWLLWVTPAYLLVARRRELAALAVFDIANFIGFPVLYGVDPFGWPSTAATLARSAVLAYLIAANYREMKAAGQLVGRMTDRQRGNGEPAPVRPPA